MIGLAVGGAGDFGAHLALDGINAGGGVNGHALERRDLRSKWKTSAQEALQAAESLARVRAALGRTG